MNTKDETGTIAILPENVEKAQAVYAEQINKAPLYLNELSRSTLTNAFSCALAALTSYKPEEIPKRTSFPIGTKFKVGNDKYHLVAYAPLRASIINLATGFPYCRAFDFDMSNEVQLPLDFLTLNPEPIEGSLS